MTSDALLDESIASFAAFQTRIQAAIGSLTEAEINRPIPNFHWTIGQICEHLLLAHSAYIALIEEGIERAPHSGATEVRYSLVGKVIAKKAGPGGNATVPSPAVPATDVTFPATIVQDVVDQIGALSRQAERAKGIPLSSIATRNPYIPLLKMNLADCFAIPVTHLEHHVRQIETESPKIRVTIA